MLTNTNQAIINEAKEALRVLIGLIPEHARRNFAGEHVEKIHTAIDGYEKALGSLKTIEGLCFHANLDVTNTLSKIEGF